MSVSKFGKLAVWIAMIVVMTTGFAGAQGFYYKEIRKDDRIYVFNIADEADRFEKTGEMGAGITRPGVGPERRNRGRRQRARAAALLLQARHLRSGPRAGAAGAARRVA